MFVHANSAPALWARRWFLFSKSFHKHHAQSARKSRHRNRGVPWIAPSPRRRIWDFQTARTTRTKNCRRSAGRRCPSPARCRSSRQFSARSPPPLCPCLRCSPRPPALRPAKFADCADAPSAGHAAAITDFYTEHLNPYLNFHRPCGVPELIVNAKGKEKRVYRWYATPWEILRQLPDVASHLKAEWTIAQLDQQAQARNDTQAALEMQEAKRKLFASFPRECAAGCVAPPVGRPRGNGAPTIKNKNIL